MSERVVAQYCPYCGDEDLTPEEEPDGAWKCHACLRVFTVRLVGLALGGSGEA
ncbi:Insertion element protein [Saccharopolyspora halophila]|uniref:Insertion element protein n=1 Tax=Saccharopolyspora halophila TaxID=405551 RepID=UPI0031DD63FE